MNKERKNDEYVAPIVNCIKVEVEKPILDVSGSGSGEKGKEEELSVGSYKLI